MEYFLVSTMILLYEYNIFILAHGTINSIIS